MRIASTHCTQLTPSTSRQWRSLNDFLSCGASSTPQPPRVTKKRRTSSLDSRITSKSLKSAVYPTITKTSTPIPGICLCMLSEENICPMASAKLVWISEQTISRHAGSVATALAFIKYNTRHNEFRLEKFGVKNHIFNPFRNHLRSTFYIECPSGRGSKDESPLMVLWAKWPG